MANIKQALASAQALTVTGLDSLASDGLATSDAVDNTSNLYLDYLVEIVIADVADGTGQICDVSFVWDE